MVCQTAGSVTHTESCCAAPEKKRLQCSVIREGVNMPLFSFSLFAWVILTSEPFRIRFPAQELARWRRTCFFFLVLKETAFHKGNIFSAIPQYLQLLFYLSFFKKILWFFNRRKQREAEKSLEHQMTMVIFSLCGCLRKQANAVGNYSVNCSVWYCTHSPFMCKLACYSPTSSSDSYMMPTAQHKAFPDAS